MSKCPHLDKALGLHEPISRRDFLDGTLMASAGMLAAAACPLSLAAQSNPQSSAAWAGYTGEGDYKNSAGNTERVMQNAHAVRDGKFDQPRTDVAETGELYDCVVVGGGLSGLSAGLFFHKQAASNRNCLILDNAQIFGGVAKRNEFVVDGHRLYAPQASVHFQPPYPNSFLKSVYDAMGLDWDAFKSYQKWQGPSPEISLPPSPYGQGSINGKPAAASFSAPSMATRQESGSPILSAKNSKARHFPKLLARKSFASTMSNPSYRPCVLRLSRRRDFSPTR